ncbi:MAG: hypothetical protein HRT98_02250 [Mycoplasmatales bacterium]|nr:hypothetical protein [Mycoplasmatales bacterium]
MNNKDIKANKTSIIRRLRKLTKEKNKIISDILEMENKNKVTFEKLEILFEIREKIAHEISIAAKKDVDKAIKKLNDKKEKNEHVIYNAEKSIETNKNKIESRKLVIKRMERTMKELDRELIRQWEVKKFKQNNNNTIEIILN